VLNLLFKPNQSEKDKKIKIKIYKKINKEEKKKEKKTKIHQERKRKSLAPTTFLLSPSI
jgi:hypothetical protein